MDAVKGPDNPAGAEEKLTRLVEAYQLPLKRMCCIWLGDYALAEDAVQETFLRAYRALPDFRGECGEKTWLMRIAVNVCHNLRRSAWFRHVDRAVDISSLPEAGVPFTARDDSLTRAIAALPHKQREVVLRRYGGAGGWHRDRLEGMRDSPRAAGGFAELQGRAVPHP